MGTELLVSEKLLEVVTGAPLSAKYFDKTPEFRVTHSANIANPHNLPLCIFYTFLLMLRYHIRKMMAKQQPPKNGSFLLKVDCLQQTEEETTR